MPCVSCTVSSKLVEHIFHFDISMAFAVTGVLAKMEANLR